MDLWLPPHDFRVRSLKTLAFGHASTPFGDCVALATESHLLALHFSPDRYTGMSGLQRAWPQATLLPSSDADRLIPFALEHPQKVSIMAVGTPFQLTVWELLRSIPSGSTMTYGEVARIIGRPKAARAVGQAVGANELAVVIPCHRIVSRGKLTGYRWGLERKKRLLAREITPSPILTPPRKVGT